MERVKIQGGSDGVLCVVGARIESCSAADFSGTGFATGFASNLSGCLARSLGFGAHLGIRTASHGLLRDCVVDTDGGGGVKVGPFSTLTRVIALNASNTGIEAGSGAHLVNCTATNCGLEEGGDGAGIRAESDVVIEGTTAAHNGAAGIRYVGSRGRVLGCSSTANDGDGVQLLSGTEARGNYVTGNVGAGIRVTGERGLIEGNLVDLNSMGIVIDGRKTLVLENRAAANNGTDFVLPWGNPHGPLDDSAFTIGGSKPQANFKTPH